MSRSLNALVVKLLWNIDNGGLDLIGGRFSRIVTWYKAGPLWEAGFISSSFNSTSARSRRGYSSQVEPLHNQFFVDLSTCLFIIMAYLHWRSNGIIYCINLLDICTCEIHWYARVSCQRVLLKQFRSSAGSKRVLWAPSQEAAALCPCTHATRKSLWFKVLRVRKEHPSFKCLLQFRKSGSSI